MPRYTAVFNADELRSAPESTPEWGVSNIIESTPSPPSELVFQGLREWVDNYPTSWRGNQPNAYWQEVQARLEAVSRSPYQPSVEARLETVPASTCPPIDFPYQRRSPTTVAVYCSNCALVGRALLAVMGDSRDLLDAKHDCRVTHKIFNCEPDDFNMAARGEMAEMLGVLHGTQIYRRPSVNLGENAGAPPLE